MEHVRNPIYDALHLKRDVPAHDYLWSDAEPFHDTEFNAGSKPLGLVSKWKGNIVQKVNKIIHRTQDGQKDQKTSCGYVMWN